MAKMYIDESYNYEELLKTFREMVDKGIPFMIVGPTGMGKTEWIKEIAGEKQKTLSVFHAARNSNTDFVAPIVDQKELTWAVAKRLRELGEKNVLAFFDEWNRSDDLTANALLSVLYDGQFEDVKFGEGTTVVFAGNEDTSRGTRALFEAEITRMPVFILDLSNLSREHSYLKYWVKIANDKLNLDSRIIQFIYAYPEYLYMHTDEIQPFPTPRSWANLSKMVDFILKETNGTRNFTIASYVGREAASKFIMFYDYILKMPKVEDLLSGKVELKEFDKRIASIDILIKYIKNQDTAEEVIKFVKNEFGDELLYLFVLLVKSNLKIASYLKKNKAAANILTDLAIIDKK